MLDGGSCIYGYIRRLVVAYLTGYIAAASSIHPQLYAGAEPKEV